MSDVASDLITNIESYQQLLTTLSLGVAAGAFALLSQIIFHNSQNTTKISMAATNCVFVAIFCHLLAILFGVLTKSALVASVPALHAINWGSGSATKYLSDTGLGHIMWFSMLQVFSFGAGMVVLFYVLWRNMHLLRP
ncbi:hypothetical protein [Rhizobium sullae]|uniref:hypothetical protein n=1 Tax=Rhizobium sullae TaxID=50338 RepID=UPI000B35C968|nr:hypothetical protein [Rhizobium sullae]